MFFDFILSCIGLLRDCWRLITKDRRLRADLIKALKNNDFRLVYQPIAKLSSGQVVGYEALIRWKLPPSDFLPQAQGVGLMRQINEFVIDEAAKTLKTLPEPLWIAVNLSEFKIKDTVDHAIHKHGIARERLCFEILESVELTREIITELEQYQGDHHKLRIDDFGNNHSNPGRFLLQLFWDGMKVDQQFVSGVASDHNKQIICKASLLAARELGLKTVIAEGIATLEDLRCLQEMGYEYGQGFYGGSGLGEPVSGDGLPKVVDS